MNKKFVNNVNSEHQWLHVSDLMSGLMMVFLFIAISYMITINNEKEKIREIAVTYEKIQNRLYDELVNEFKNDLVKWDAEIDKQTLSFRFKAPDILFNVGSDKLRLRFKKILNDFFPRFIRILTKPNFKNEIDEIRIEGHTSSEWSYQVPNDVAYFKNMRLSQDRTRAVLKYVVSLPELVTYKAWMKKLITANGLSSSKLILNKFGIEDKEKSRRVEFRVRTNAEKRIVKIIEETK